MDTIEKIAKIDDKHKMEKENYFENFFFMINEEKFAIHFDKYGIINKLVIPDSPKKSFDKLLDNCFTNSNQKEIGMNDMEFFIGMGIINELNKNPNIILKLINFYPNGPLSDDYFKLHKTDCKKFIEELNIDYFPFKNRIVIVPLNIDYHFSLLLIYQMELYLIDYGMIHSTDCYLNDMIKKMEQFESSISEYLINKNLNNFEIEVFNIIENFEEDEKKYKLKQINEQLNNKELFDLVTNYNTIRKKKIVILYYQKVVAKVQLILLKMKI